MNQAEFYTFLNLIHFNDWAFILYGLIGFIGIHFLNKHLINKGDGKYSFGKGKTGWPGDGFANRTTVGKRSSTYPKTHPRK